MYICICIYVYVCVCVCVCMCVCVDLWEEWSLCFRSFYWTMVGSSPAKHRMRYLVKWLKTRTKQKMSLWNHSATLRHVSTPHLNFLRVETSQSRRGNSCQAHRKSHGPRCHQAALVLIFRQWLDLPQQNSHVIPFNIYIHIHIITHVYIYTTIREKGHHEPMWPRDLFTSSTG